jgi:hypothetical protein
MTLRWAKGSYPGALRPHQRRGGSDHSSLTGEKRVPSGTFTSEDT